MMNMVPAQCGPGAPYSEQQVFEHIRKSQPSETYYCFHSLGIERHERKEYAECDLVILGPRGIFCLEVKGGVVKRSAGVWTIGSGARSYTSLEGPFRQAESARWALLKWLETNRIITRKETLFGWGVALPSIIFEEVDPSWAPDVIYDLRDTEPSFTVYLNRLESYFVQRRTETGRAIPHPLSERRIRDCADALRPDFEAGLSLRGLMIEGHKEVVELSREQFRVLDFTLRDENPRLLCSGGPGTGKTVVAMEASRRLAAAGKKVLHLCFNAQLAAVLDRERREKNGRFRVQTLHGFMGRHIRSAGIALENPSLSDAPCYFEQEYPILFEDACLMLLEEDRLPQYDALVIDEAQDVLNDKTLDCLSLVLTGGIKSGNWAVFFDPDAQANVYGRFEQKSLDNLQRFGAVTVELRENFRNPKKVVSEAYSVTDHPLPVCRRQLNSPVEYIQVIGDKKAAAKLRALLVDLIRDGISPSDIALLSFRRNGDRLFDRFPPDIGKRLLSPAENIGVQDAIIVGTISGFKGLESEVVIVTDIPDQLADTWQRSLFLVALTRTRTKCFVLASDAFLSHRTEMFLTKLAPELDMG